MKKINQKIILLSVALLAVFAISNVASASDFTGYLSTGVSTGVIGIVIAPPLANPSAGTYTSAQSVTLSADGSTNIYYTTDGVTVPNCSAHGTLYSGPISVSSSEMIQAISCYPNSIVSTVASYLYGINPPAVASGSGIVSNGGGGGGGGYVAPALTLAPVGQVLGASTGPTSTVIPGCDNRTTGFSITTGQSCVGNTGTATTPVGQVLGAESFHFTLTLKMGSKGNEVMELQKFLNNAGYNVGKADGSFGAKTKAAVIKLEIANKLKGDGVVGAKVRAILNA